MNYIGEVKSIKNFQEAFIELINIYEIKNKYLEGKFSITRAYALYLLIENVNPLKKFETDKIIINNYKKYLEDYNIEYKKEDNCNELIGKYYDNIENVNKENNYSSNFQSSSSVDSKEEVIYDFIPFEDNDDNDNGNSPDTFDKNKENNKSKKRKKDFNNKEGKKNNKKTKKSQKSQLIEYLFINDKKRYKEDIIDFKYNLIKNNQICFI